MPSLIDLTDQTFGRLTVIEREGSAPCGEATWRCRCGCGNETVVRSSVLRHGLATSCGCPEPEELEPEEVDIFRVRRDLSTGHERGDLIYASELDEDVVEPLMDVHAITEMHAPPLEVLPGWEDRARRLNRLGITSVSAFLGADEEELAERLDCPSETIEGWKREVEDYIS